MDVLAELENIDDECDQKVMPISANETTFFFEIT